MKSSVIQQAVTQDLHHGSAQLPLASRRKKRVSPGTLAAQLYQSHALEIAEEYEQALEANSLEKIKILLDKLV